MNLEVSSGSMESKLLKFLGFMWNPLSWVMESDAIMAIALANGGEMAAAGTWCFSGTTTGEFSLGSEGGIGAVYNAEYKMESEEPVLTKIFQIFSDFMLRVMQFEELVAVGSRLLVGFDEGLESLRQSPINKTSELVKRIIETNKTKRVLKYVGAGCINAHDGMQNISRRKCIVYELEGLVKEVTSAVQAGNENKLHLKDKVTGDLIGQEATTYKKSITVGFVLQEKIVSSNVHGPEIPEYAVMMGVIYSMLKRDYIMQEKIISSLNLKSSSGELESYNLMWSLRPFIDDEIMHQAWRLVA
ncbi:hypothetical protein RHGRI_028951 [Rhododendron griersonianum]|uniref:DUF7795 domain-containing protein n=1 Tax=Rhododendron griersonianum TaxID=479676 RepID=A0AAV6IL31_9ERIC|nr:hypothetical protein RHGRI_028951 [Rhododendron griersonianum]